ncbi:family 43 glycosylhydrolase [Micromonospora endolithica]|uniref:Glycoside hydrolase n=1 Tax=Micromonospora endolithica TaxID=230091 RepID=A0A3A9ZJ25_9ACTN|nr:RICIN domain-containing protein [Micromonospora endolithica]RKN47784.1 glycoside hydrolase [Micromonospora endolithica]TWJ21462.1 beta-xylosidase [Micromonospora endolithica]
MVAIGRVPWTAPSARGRGRRWRVFAAAVAVLLGGALAAIAPTPASAATVDTNAWYVLVNRNSGKALDLFNRATNDGARISQWSRNDGTNQQWQFVDSGGGYYRLKSRHSGKVLDVYNFSTANGASIVQWADGNGTNQQFRLADSTGGYVRLINRNSNKVVEVQGASTADGGNIVQYDDWNGTNQQWQLVRVDGGGNPTTPPPGGSFNNPVVWQDFADVDIIRVDNTYYMSASTMHYSPGAPVLRSYDLVNWEFAGHSVPRLDFGSKYDMNGGRAYVDGIWASTLNYRPSNRTFYWAGCIDFAQTHIYTASAVDGAWTRHATIPNCYYDAGMLIDDNDTMYVAYGNGAISVAQLSADGRTQVHNQQVYTTPSSIGTLEGARFYKRNGAYYIWLTRPANGQYVLKSTNGPFGPYEQRQVLLDLPGPIAGGGVPHQGGLVQTQNGDWYYMAFTDAYPGGRMPTMAPITWTADGWPQLQTVNGRWGNSYPVPNLPAPPRAVKPLTGVDTFAGTTLGPQWEWNHNPDTARFSVNNGLRLQTATVTNDLYAARNTLTHRIQGPSSTATVELDYSAMQNGDRSGLSVFRNTSAWIGVRRDNGSTRVVMQNNLTMDGNWNTTSTGTEVASAPVSGGRIWLRATADIRPGSGRQATFSYSTDGVTFTPLGNALTLANNWQFFMGYRFAIFNHATQALGGAVTVRRFDLATP